MIFQGTYGDPNLPNTEWLEYEFKCKPGTLLIQGTSINIHLRLQMIGILK